MLSNFITPNDPYVTPIPDRRLARVGMTTLSADIDATTDSIPIESPTFFNQAQQSFLRASTVGDEIMQCTAVSDDAPWHLSGCARGAFGTAAKAHAGGSEIAKLDDHGYNVFLTNADLTVEMSRNMAHLFNETGLRQISFDGLEGNRSTGMGNYGEILFTQAWYDALNPNIRSHYIADASRTSHFFWHMYSRMNWGEPWYAGFRESQTEYRLKNQAYFRRNLMPGMLGWFSMRPETSIEDIEWMLARSAGFDAGYGFVTGFEAIEENGHSAQILALLGLWENARMNDIFSESQKKAMQDINNEFHLEAIDDAVWDLYPVTSFKFSHNARERQPGEPRSSTFSFSSGPGDEELGFLLSAVGGRLSGIEIEMENHSGFAIPLTIDEGQHLKYSGGDSATLFSNSWQEIQEVAVPSYWMTVSPGDHVIRFYAEMEGSDDAEAKFEVRLTGAPERIVKQE
jgi:hypothetical protein